MLRAAAVLGLAIPVAAVAQPADPFAPARADIPKYCKIQNTQSQQTCIKQQKHGLARFVTIMAGFHDPGKRVAKKCMIGGKTGKFINWVSAKTCMQSAASGIPLGGKLKIE